MAYLLDHCKDCEYVRRCDVWGELKCVKKEKRLYSDDPIGCEEFKKRKGDIAKCRCEDCENRGELED